MLKRPVKTFCPPPPYILLRDVCLHLHSRIFYWYIQGTSQSHLQTVEGGGMFGRDRHRSDAVSLTSVNCCELQRSIPLMFGLNIPKCMFRFGKLSLSWFGFYRERWRLGGRGECHVMCRTCSHLFCR